MSRHSTTCPRCAGHMDDVTVIDNILRASCVCGWSGVKRAGFPGITITQQKDQP